MLLGPQHSWSAKTEMCAVSAKFLQEILCIRRILVENNIANPTAVTVTLSHTFRWLHHIITCSPDSHSLTLVFQCPKSFLEKKYRPQILPWLVLFSQEHPQPWQNKSPRHLRLPPSLVSWYSPGVVLGHPPNPVREAARPPVQTSPNTNREVTGSSQGHTAA